MATSTVWRVHRSLAGKVVELQAQPAPVTHSWVASNLVVSPCDKSDRLLLENK